jgi:LysM repeat protein
MQINKNKLRYVNLPNDRNGNDEDCKYYTVKEGDTLFNIAKDNHTSMQKIMKINHLKSNLVYKGEVLKIPYDNENYYIVKEHDTLESIAEECNVDVEYIKQHNHLPNNTLEIGQIIMF